MGAYPSIIGIVNIPFSYDSGLGSVTNYRMDVPLPDGLFLDNVTGRIYGTSAVPLSISGNVTGFYNDSFDIGIPYNIEISSGSTLYGDDTFYYVIYDSFELEPYVIGADTNISEYTINPPLPTGASINYISGTISGSVETYPVNPITYTITFKHIPSDGSHTTSFTMGGGQAYYNDINASYGNVISTYPVTVGSSGFSLDEDFDNTSDPVGFGDLGLSVNENTGEISGIIIGAPGIYEFNVGYAVGGWGHSAQLCIYISEPECLRGDMQILTTTGYKPIEKLTTNDYVITNAIKNTNPRKIKTIHSVDHVGSLYVIPKRSLSIVYPLNDIYLSGNHKFYFNGRWYRPKTRCKKINITSPIKLYHVELDNPDENFIVEGVIMESYTRKKEQ